jgi:hypothetical protein
VGQGAYLNSLVLRTFAQKVHRMNSVPLGA